MKKVNWIPIAIAEKTDDSRITKSGWIKPQNGDSVHNMFYIAEKINDNPLSHDARFFQMTASIPLKELEMMDSEERKNTYKAKEAEFIREMKIIADRYENTGEWPK